jgi:hypothetical protein
MVNNFEKIAPLLEFPVPGDSFYFVQILQRKKDFPGVRIGGSNNNSRLIKTYYITSQEHLYIHQEEMIKLAEVFGARVCINLNPRSFEKAGFQVIQKIANQMQNKDFYGIRKAYDSICGNYHAEMDKRWLVDIDSLDLMLVDHIEGMINQLHAKIENREYKIITRIPTKNGYHLISNPFNLAEFQKQCLNIPLRFNEGKFDVHKNNPTLLYCV